MMEPIEEDAFLRLYLANERPLRLFLRVCLPSWSDVDDVVQETCIVAMKRFDTFEQGTNFRAWLLTIGRFEALRHKRKRSTSRLTISAEVMQLLEEEITSAEENGSTTRDALEDCIAKLPEAAQDLLKAVYTHGTSVQTLAEQANRSVDAIYKRLQRLRQMLLDCIEHVLSAEGR